MDAVRNHYNSQRQHHQNASLQQQPQLHHHYHVHHANHRPAFVGEPTNRDRTVHVRAEQYSDVILVIPIDDVAHKPEGVRQHLLCPAYARGGAAACTAGEACQFVHAQLTRARRFLAHVQRYWTSFDEIPYTRASMVGLASIIVTHAHQPDSPEVVPIEFVLRTRALDYAHVQSGLQHCNHFSRKGSCDLGEQCKFVHCIRLHATSPNFTSPPSAPAQHLPSSHAPSPLADVPSLVAAPHNLHHHSTSGTAAQNTMLPPWQPATPTNAPTPTTGKQAVGVPAAAMIGLLGSPTRNNSFSRRSWPFRHDPYAAVPIDSVSTEPEMTTDDSIPE
jgi:hypothetical protein